MEIRDLFAAIGLHAHLSVPESDNTPDFCAELAYRYADAMLKAREPKQEPLPAGAWIDIPIARQSCQYALKRLSAKAIKEKRHHISWAVVHPGHAGFPTIFETKKLAETYRKEHAGAYIVCRVAVIPLYGNIYGRDYA